VRINVDMGWIRISAPAEAGRPHKAVMEKGAIGGREDKTWLRPECCVHVHAEEQGLYERWRRC
jgi:hypothetical protein